MSGKKWAGTLFAILVSNFLIGQGLEKYDMVSFERPKGWERVNGPGYLAFTKFIPSSKEYARILLYESQPSSGSLDFDFETDWQELVAQHYKPKEFTNLSKTPFNPEWNAVLAIAPFSYQDQNHAAVLVTLSDNKRKLSYVFITNSTAFETELEDFGSSIIFEEGKNTNGTASILDHKSNVSPSSPAVANASITTLNQNFGISVFPTNFDDGWKSMPKEDWVEVTQGNLKVLLHYGRNFDDVMRQDAVGVNWETLIPPRFQVNQRYFFQNSTFDFPYYYTEGEVTELASGKSMYLGFLVVPLNGVAYAIEVQAPDKASFTQTFPNIGSIEGMRGYNRFGLSLQDLVGNWQSFSSSSISLYNVYTGGLAGMNYASINDQFTFGPTGNYSSKHVGASSSYGNTSHFNDQFSGNASITHWEMALSNRKDGRSDAYHAYFEAVKGGKILHMTHKQWSGLTFTLIQER